jgi:hypothetical protein
MRGMEPDGVIQQFKEHRDRIHTRLEELRRQTDALLEELTQRSPTAADAAELERIRGRPKELLQDYFVETSALIEHVARVIESNRRSEMAEKSERPARPARNQAQIQKLSEELTTQLRMERVDGAIKELLDFLADSEFFAANATTGRRRRLRSLQNGIEKALAAK